MKLRWAIAVVGMTMVTIFWLFVDLGGTVRGFIHPLAAIPIALWGGPFLLYAKQLKTPVLSVVTGVALLVAAVGMLVPLMKTDSSTAGIGVLFGAIYLYGGVGLTIIVDRALEHRDTAEGRSPGDLPLASLRARFLARVVDVAVMSPVGVAWGVLLSSPDPTLAWVSFAAPAVVVLDELAMTALRGQTIGKIALRIRIVAEDAPRRGIGWGRAMLRLLLPLLAVVFPILPPLVLAPYLWALADKNRRGWHDQIARTRVVRARSSLIV